MYLKTFHKHRLHGVLGICIGTTGVLLAALLSQKVEKKTEDPVAYVASEVRMNSVSGVALDAEGLSYETMEVTMVAAQDTSAFAGKFVANITDTLNVRAAASTESDIVGKMYPGCVGDVLGTEGEWTQISSGEVTGYVKTEFILIGAEGEAKAAESKRVIGTIHADTLRIREEASTESSAIGLLADNDAVNVTETLDGWYKICTSQGTEGYISAEFVSVEETYETAITIEEEQRRIAEAEAAREAEAAEAAAEAAQVATDNSVAVSASQRAATAASYDDAYLLACLISMEAGSEPYEGQLAVANVVLNRLHSGYCGNSIAEVIYAPGQFPTVNGSVMNGFLANGPVPSCQQAANEALAGNNNIGGYMYFINVRCANYGAYGEYTIIGNHCFH